MNIDDAVKILKRHNKWRRYDGDINEQPKMIDVTTLGIAIDTVIETFEIRTKSDFNYE